MPDTLQWNFAQAWRDQNISDTGVVNALAPALAIMDGFKSGSLNGATEGLKQAAAQLAASIGESRLGIPKDVSLAAMGYAVNPQIDVIYTAPALRTFTFEFTFAPRSRKETTEVLSIIRALKFYSAPEIPTVSGFGYTMIPPGDFDIEFSISTIGKISTCVLRNIDIDYSPNGFAAYADPVNPADGMPVQIRMRLEFQEIEFITKDLILAGY
jgi:hypothetical protein